MRAGRMIAVVSVGVAGAGGAFALECDAAQTQLDMTQCAYEDFMAADAELNATYGRSMDRATAWGGDAAVALRAAQRAWVPFRDAACYAEGTLFEGGSIQPMIVQSCKADLTRRRTQDLRRLYQTR